MKRKYYIFALIIALSLNNVCFADNQQTNPPKHVFSLRNVLLGDNVQTNASYTWEANSYIKKGNLEKASKSIEKAIYFYDSNPLTYVIKGELEILNNNISGAKADYQKASDIIENNTKYKNGKQYVEHDDRLYNTYTQNTLWERIDKGLAKIALKENNLKEAKENIDYIRKNWHYMDNEVFLIESEYYKANNQQNYADVYKEIYNELESLDKKIKANPNNAENYYEKAQLLFYNADENKFALAYINQALKLDEKSEYFLLKSHLVNKKEDKIKCLNDAVLSNPNNANAYYQRAIFYYDDERYQDALNDYKKSIELDLYSEDELIEEIGYCYSKLGNYDKALEYFSKSNDYLGYKADVLVDMGKYKDALNIYNKIINDSDYDKKSVLRNIAICKDNLGNKQGALQDYTKLINMGDIDSYYNRGELNYRLKKYQSAIKDMNNYIDKMGNSYDAMYIRAKSYMSVGNYSKALQDFTIDNRYTLDSLYNTAYCKYKMGDRYGAYKLLLEIRKNDNFMIEDVKTYQKAINLFNNL